MTRNQLHELLRDAALATVPLAGAAFVFLLWPTRSAIQSNAAATTALIHRGNQSLDGVDRVTATANSELAALNAPCVDFHGSVTCGALVQLAQTEKNIGILAAQGAEQVKQSGTLISATAENMNQVGSHVSTAVDSIGGTARSATATIDAGRSYFVASQPRIDQFLAHVDALTVSGNQSVEQFNSMLADPRIGLIESNFVSISGSGAHMMQTTDAVETKVTQCTLHPTLACNLKAYTLLGAQAGGYLLQALPK